MTLTIDLGRDGDPNSNKAASTWIILKDGTFHIEVEYYKEVTVFMENDKAK